MTDIPEPFRPADALYRKFKPYLRACAHVVRVVPGLKLEELRAAHSAAVWREEQNPEWAFEAIAKRKKQMEKERREMNPGLAEIMKQQQQQQQQAGGDGAEDAEGGGGKKKKKKKKKTKGKKAGGENKAEL